jgi:hypothetical protein
LSVLTLALLMDLQLLYPNGVMDWSAMTNAE